MEKPIAGLFRRPRGPLDNRKADVQPEGYDRASAPPIYEVLKDFQPTLAAVIALLAASLAYLTATQKTRLDRRLAERELAYRKLGILTRARYEVRLIVLMAIYLPKSTRQLDTILMSGAKFEPRQRALDTATRHFRNTPHLDDLWQNLQYFPQTLARDVDELRRRLFALSGTLDPVLYRTLPDAGRGPELIASRGGEVEKIADSLLVEFDRIIEGTEAELARHR
ncbi:hypothetical protein N2603_23415 [Bradyrhizobium huanghuaihaiense]|uniref:hypothetical protein n=1 Tax=Bradyrhizobium huanghuaihaiense TaxID=990078 RepID=UPI0021AA801C|nr:hypothetical protein [Bradyrhizobium sp. CB3035]UWU73056.1 hypothetical protein N2603_23415 [Bradyrhizobium sp. CB3035]